MVAAARLAEHIERVNTCIAGGKLPPALRPSEAVARSWSRCAESFGLDPARTPEPLVLDAHDLVERRERMDPLLAIAETEMTNLYHQISGSGFAVLLTDADGIVLNYVRDPTLTDMTEKAGLVPGGVWSEARQGTNGMGTCLADEAPMIVHRGDHFFARNVALTCSAAPVFDPSGALQAVLDASSTSKDSRRAQQHTMALVNMSAQTIENCWLLSHYRHDYVLRFHSRPEFVTILGEGILALSEAGRIVAANRSALVQLDFSVRDELIGRSIDSVFDINPDELLRGSSPYRDAVQPVFHAGDRRRYFASLRAPARTPRLSLAVKAGESAKPNESRVREAAFDLDALSDGDPLMSRNVATARRVAHAGIPILLCGETGTGKDVFAKAIHDIGARAEGPFVAVNCAAIPEALIESELFGYRAGAFTGARREGARGRILQANGGTLFLDEIGDMPLNLQTRLLRVLEEQEIHPLGSDSPLRVDVEVVSATNRDLTRLIAEATFREDLYYRLRGVELRLPALRERSDKEALIRRLLELVAGKRATIEPRALAALMTYRWPGNIRELRNVLRTAAVMSDDATVCLWSLPPEVSCPADCIEGVPTPSASPAVNDDNALASAERDALILELERNRWNITGTASKLGVSRNTMYRKLKKHGISLTHG